MLSNNDVKYFSSLKQKKSRTSEKKFLIEGFHLAEECLNSSYSIETIILRTGTSFDGHDSISKSIKKKSISIETLSEKQFLKLTETENSQGIIAVVNMPRQRDYDSFGNYVIALDRVNDPGNLGTIIRTAYWFGIDTVLLSTGSADIYNSKVLRSSQGAVFHANIVNDTYLKDKLNTLSKDGYNVFLLDVSAETKLEEIQPGTKGVFVFGNEGEGISSDISGDGYQKLKIEGHSGCESLNVAVSAGILMFYLKNSRKIV